MTMLTLCKPATGRAIWTAVFMTAAVSAVTASDAARATGSPLPNDPFMQIHMDNQKIGSAVSNYWQAQAATAAENASGRRKPLWERQTDSAYLTVFAHYCAPAVVGRATGEVAANSIEVALYTDRFRVEYAGNCRAFYLNEVATRIDLPGDQALQCVQRP